MKDTERNIGSTQLKTNQVSTQLLETMLRKRSNLCVAVDLQSAQDILALVEKVMSNYRVNCLTNSQLVYISDSFFLSLIYLYRHLFLHFFLSMSFSVSLCFCLYLYMCIVYVYVSVSVFISINLDVSRFI